MASASAASEEKPATIQARRRRVEAKISPDEHAGRGAEHGGADARSERDVRHQAEGGRAHDQDAQRVAHEAQRRAEERVLVRVADGLHPAAVCT
ncbi:MAG: hypothetical protein M5U28_29970 [Sandaracinaceae bacterium]|nr:hypothetical protein [Sandaracinaceae bacterium]